MFQCGRCDGACWSEAQAGVNVARIGRIIGRWYVGWRGRRSWTLSVNSSPTLALNSASIHICSRLGAGVLFGGGGLRRAEVGCRLVRVPGRRLPNTVSQRRIGFLVSVRGVMQLVELQVSSLSS